MAPYDHSLECALFPISLIEILFLIFLNWVIEKFFFGLLYIFLLCVTFLSYVLWKSLSHSAATCKPTVRRNACDGLSKENVENGMLVIETRGAVSDSGRCPRKLSIGEVKTMIEVFDECYNRGENIGLDIEIEELFDKEPSLGEVKEAFDLFDENRDGFIDEEDLKNVLSAMGFTVGLEVDQCKKMISVFDNNGDGLIDFGEFARLIELSFCSVKN